MGTETLPRSLRPRWTLYLADRLSSTNTLAWELVEAGAASGTVVIATRQSAGRGQWGRQWTSPPGGLYLSLVLQPDVPVQESWGLTLASAWGIVSELAALKLPVQIKWPNDLVYQGRKLGGLLTETRVVQQRIQTAVIGLGMNWSNPVPPTGVALRHHLPSPSPALLKTLEDLAALALRGILHGYCYWLTAGSPALITAYQDKLANLGQAVTVNGHSGQITGVSSQGQLVVTLDKMGTFEAICLDPGEIQLGYER